MIRFVPENCFRLLFLNGLFCLIYAVATYPPIAVAGKLDALMAPEEYADPTKVAAMRSLLERAEGRQWIMWLIVGGANLSLSIIGLYSYLPAQVATVRAWTKSVDSRT